MPYAVKAAAAALILAGSLAACTPTVRLKVDPITIYAKLDANVKIQLDKEVQALIEKRQDLF